MTTRIYQNQKRESSIKSYLRLCYFVLLTCFSYLASAQVTVNPGAGSYTTVSAAFTAINSGTHTGAITIAIASPGTTEPAAPTALVASGVGSANYSSIAIYPTAASVIITGTSNVNRGVLEFNGVDNVTINGNLNNGVGTVRNLTIRNNTAVTNAHAVLWFQGTTTSPQLGATNIIIKNIIVIGNGNSGGASGTTTYSTGICFAGTANVSSTTLGANHQNITITNNEIKKVNTGIHMGNATAAPILNLLIDNNEIGSATASDYVYFRGMYLSNTSASIIRQNHIFNIRPSLTTQSTVRTGIEISGTGSASITIDRNNIHGMGTFTTATGTGGFGISLGGGNNHLVLNNLIYDIDGYGTTTISNGPQGIRLELGTGHKVYYNSVHLFGNLTGTGTRYSAAFAVAATSVEGIDVRNNIFSNRMVPTSGTAENMAVWFVASYDFAASGNIMNNNAYFVTPSSANHFVGKVGVTVSANNYQSLGSWQTISGVDAQSLPAVNALAPFTSNTNLTIPAASATGCESAAVPIASIGLPNTDYVGVNRPAGTGIAPDMGAYEFNGAACTAPPTAGDATKIPVTPVCPSANVVLNLTSNSTGSGQTYQWFSDPSQFGSYATSVSGVLATPYFTINPATTLWYRCVVTCSANSQNSTPIEVVVTLGLSGTYTIDPSGSGPANFTTFNGAVAALSVCGVSGPVVFNVAAGNTFNEQITIPVILNSSATNTVTFNGNGSTLQFASTNTASRHVIKLDGADYVTFDNLIINANPGGGTYGWGVHFINQADHNTISNCNISTSTTDVTSGSYYGIIMSNSTSSISAGNSANYTMISGNTITGGYYTVAFYGQTTVGLKAQSNSLINNIIRDSYGYTAYLIYQANMVVRGNNVSRPTRGASIATAGAIYTSSGDGGSLIEKNYIHDMFQNIPGGSATMYGIYHGNDATSGATDIVQNNVIYNMNNSNNTVYGLYSTGSPYVKYYHNSISLDDVLATGTAATYGMYQTGTAAGIEYINNVVSVSRGGSGVKACIFLNTIANTIVSNNNDLYMNSAGGNTGQWGASTFATIGDWQTANANAYDQASFGVNPGFVSPSSGNLKPTSSTIDNTGQNLGIATDILGVVRGVNPDPGAYEFVPVTLDASIAWVSPTTPVTGGLNTITVSVTNNQNTAITDLVLGYTDGVTPQSQTFSGLNITIGNSQQFSFTTQYNFGASSSSLQGYITSVNGLTDANQLNDTTATQILCASLSGAYTINSGVATGGTNFQTFTAAVNRLICGGVNGAVTFNVVSSTGPYTEQIAIPAITGASAINTITFNGNGNTLTYSLTNASARHVVRLEGADYITINNLTIVSTTGTYGWGVHFYNGADHNTISNCTITVGASTSTSGDFAAIAMTNSFTSLTIAGNNGNYNTIFGNTMSGGYYTIAAYGSSTAGLQNLNNTISNNTLSNSYDYTIYALGQKNIVISQNDISRPTRTSIATSSSGIFLSTGCLNSLIEKNRLHNYFGAVLSNTLISYGIYIAADGTVLEPNRVINNLVYDIQGNGTIYGIYNSGADYMLAYHNTISLDYLPATTAITSGFHQATVASGIEIKNNIVYITRGGSGEKVGMNFTQTGSSIISNNNDIYVNGSGSGANNTGTFGTTDYGSLGAWQTANSNAYDAQSRADNPGFTNPSISNFSPTNSLIDDMGVNVGISTDILNAARNATTPDAGAYEFTPVAIDGSIAWVSPVAAFTPGLNTITVSVTNIQAAAITSLDLTYTDGSTPVTQSFTGLNIAQSATQQFSFTTQYNINGNAFLKAYITAVNGISDGNQLNDTTASQEICVPLAGGTYTINSALVTGGSNFQSFSAAFGRLAYCGMAGPIIFNVASGSGPYLEQLTIPFISGSSSVNTIVVNGNGRTIRATASVGAKHTIGLNGANYISFDNLIIESGNITYGIGIHLTNASDHIAITNCTINLTATTSTTEDNTAGIVSSASPTDVNLQGNNASYLTITGNTIISGFQGIILNGATGGLNATNIVINNNIIRDFYSKGISLANNNGTQLNNNNINRATRVGVTSFYGIELIAGNTNVLINANRIHDTHNNATTQSALAYGIYFSSCDAPVGSENRATNNVIYNFNSATGIAYAFHNAGSDGTFMYHNTIALNNTASTDGNTYGLYQTTAATNIRFINNIVSITRGGIGIKNCLYFNTPTSSITSNNNDLYLNALSGTIGVGYHNSINYTTLANWKTANGGIYDALSKSLNPGFTNPGAGDFTPTQSQLNAIGANVGVTTDINGNPRSALPDIGAYEFTTVGLDAGISWVSPVSPLTAGLKTITVNITNTQTATITDLDLAYTDGTITEAESFTGLNIVGSASQQLSFTVQYNLTNSSALRAYISNVNTILDADQTNDTTATQNLCLAMSGVYTINSAAATSGSNFQNFTDAVNQLICGGVSGPVTLNVNNASGPYNEQIKIPSITGTSDVNTITFNGNGRTLTYLSTNSNERATLTLNDADYITVNNLTIAATGATATEYGFGVQMLNNADHNNISNCTITTTQTPATASSVSFAGVVINSSSVAITTGNSQCDSNTVSGCTISGGLYGVALVANSSTNMIYGNKILNNTIRDFYEFGIYMNGTNGALIEGNSISRPSRASVTTFRGIYSTGNSYNQLINRNRIFDPFGGQVNSTVAGFCIYHTSCDAVLGSENIVSNNLMYGHVAGTGNHNGIINAGSDYVKYYHNTIVLNDVNATCTTCAARGFYQQSPHPIGLEFVNNIVSVTQGGDAPKQCIFFENPSVAGYVLNGNNYYITSTGGLYNEIARIGGSATVPATGTGFATIAAWKTGSSQETNSVSVNPFFTNPGTGNYAPRVIQADNIGVPVGILTDINVATRSTSTPDAGAYEYTGTINDFCTGTPSAGTASGSNNLCYNQAATLTLTGFTSLVGITLQWKQSSVSGGPYVPVTGGSGANTATYFTPVLSATTYYVCEVSCAGGSSATSNEVTATITAPALLSFNGGQRCGYGVVNLSATSTTGNVAWYSQASGGSLLATGTSYSPTVNGTTSFYAAAIEPLAPSPVATSFSGNILGTVAGQTAGGNMFNIAATNQITINSFDIHLQVDASKGPSDIDVYYKVGTYVGFTTSPGAWTMIGSTTGLVSSGIGVPTPLPIPINITIPAGQVYAFYIVAKNLDVANPVRYTNSAASPAEGAVAASDFNIQIQSGTAMFGPFTTAVAAPAKRMWNGRVNYTYNCEGPRTAVVATVDPAPAVTFATNHSTLCTGQTATLTATTSNPGYTITWNPGNLTGSSINVNPSSNTTYSVIAVDNSGGPFDQCAVIGSVQVDKSAGSPPQPLASGGGFVCEGSDLAFSGDNIAVGQTSGNTYSWYLPSGVLFSSQQNPTINNVTAANNGTYTLNVTNQYLCNEYTTIDATINLAPSLSVLSTQNVGCVGGSDGSITVGATTGAPNYDFTTDFINFVNDPSQATFTNLPTGPTTIFVSDANGCNSQISASLTAISTVPPSAAVVVPFIGMPTNVCNGTTATLSIPAVSNTTMYIWDAPGAAYFNGNPLNVSPFTTSTPSVTVTYSTPGGSLYVTGVQAANGCGASLRKVQKTRGTISVPAIVSGSTTACANTTGTYSTGAVDAASSYQWTITGDATVSGTGTTATVTFGPAWNGGTLCVAAQTSCYTSPAKCITLSKSASTLNAISGAFTACPNTTLSYSVPPSTGAASYTWTLPAGSTGSSTTNSISVTYGPGYSAAGSICVSVTSVCGVTSAIKCKTVAPGLPGQPSSITGALAGLCNQTVAYSCPSQGAGVTYNWTSPGSITSGQGSTSISTTFAALSTGNVCVTASNSCGSSLARCVPVKGAPNAPGAITATPSSWCANTPGIEFNVSTGSLTGSYTLSWAYPNASVVTYAFGGGNSTSLILDWISGSGAVNVTASNACGGATKPSTWSSTCREGETGTVSSMTVSPNPTTGVVNVNYTATKGSTVINVLDLAGRVVMTQATSSVEGVNTTQLDMSKLAKGAYMLSVQSTQGNKQIKVVVE